ncbi:MAG TPA: adenine deaminase [Smithellaceae bacterium]|nr:adenine deaminase [Smithellaceae bacterium]
MSSLDVSGNIVDLRKKRIYPGTLRIENGHITAIREDNNHYNSYVLPGFIDAHVHVESSLLVPTEFARLAVAHGTVAAVSDPHEIANVLGMEGVNFMVEEGRKTPFHFYFGASSCVPATTFETAGAVLKSADVEKLLRNPEIKYLSEMMNFPGVINGDPEVLAKITVAKKQGKPVDGHAPALRGEALRKYAAAGISTDHETISLEEGLEKISLGMKIIIREGSAAKNFAALSDLLRTNPELCMFCSDDKHPDEFVISHINNIVKRAVREGYDLMDVLRSASLNPVRHYGLDAGLLQLNDPADFIVVDNWRDFNVLETFIGGRKVAAGGISLLSSSPVSAGNLFVADFVSADDIRVKKAADNINVIVINDGQVLTGRVTAQAKEERGFVVSDAEHDILKLVVVNRYQNVPPAVGFVRNCGLKKGAIASSVAHDSHNVIAVGVADDDITAALNLVIKSKGGLAAVCEGEENILPLPIAGLMSDDDGYAVAAKYQRLDCLVKSEMGSPLHAPFMALSFLALLVIPSLKLSDKGLFDGEKFAFTQLFV